ncbi:MAG: chemotaxis response regulator protein-glutamate methylesterase [Minwuiales bacterium]|nr:chemotaxis response regulator protein-glutamate methylesterase [Minwuiales bacterium]
MTQPTTAVIVDDSALMRQMLSEMLGSDPEIEVLGTAADPIAARALIKSTNPDVITLDVEMPKMDGLTFLEKIMTLRPTPVLMISSLTQKGADTTIQALELGAIDFVAKPTIDLKEGMTAKRDEIVRKVKAAARAKLRPRSSPSARKPKARQAGRVLRSTEQVILIGASTGGVNAIRDIVCTLPVDCPAVLVTQHMPAGFTRSFAGRLDADSAVSVAEAAHGQRAMPGQVLIAPGNRHLELSRSGADYICRLRDSAAVSGHRPSVDVLFRSAAKCAGPNAVGVILTGMGRDGAAGMLELRRSGARTLGQDEASSIVYGMPKAAWDIGAVESQVSLSKVVDTVLDLCSQRAARKVHI